MELTSRTLWQEAIFAFEEENRRNTVAKIVAINLVSFILFFPLETKYFHMMVSESLMVRSVAAVFNTLTAIYWSRIESHFKEKMSHVPGIRWMWLRNKIEHLWEEVSLITVKMIVNLNSYVTVAIILWHVGDPVKLLIKVCIIVVISCLIADPLKYKVVPFFEWVIFDRKRSSFRGYFIEEMEVGTNTATQDPILQFPAITGSAEQAVAKEQELVN
ncbi:MAG: hypothetical protein QG551_6 [Patescibacteria group bacterium]|jgi:hypothetical protein|nr:hypothetical protein [Patescibacteria group bacterium]